MAPAVLPAKMNGRLRVNFLKTIFLIGCIVVVAVMGGAASGQCVPDGNNDEAAATTIGYQEVVTDWVCPDDPFDYYVIEIYDGANVSGKITFSSPHASTVIRVYHKDTGTRILDDLSTTADKKTVSLDIKPGMLKDGTYYARVFFWSSSAFDHKYTLSMNLTGASNCIPDNNEVPQNAPYLAYQMSVGGWVCDADHLDIWHIKVNSTAEGSAKLILNADPGELFLYLYDSAQTQIFQGKTASGKLEYNLDSGGAPLSPGDYYAGVFLPETRTDENYYELSLEPNEAPGTFVIGESLIAEMPGDVTGKLIQVVLTRPVFARIVADSLYCIEESDVDAGSNSDEPYVLFGTLASYKKPKAWSPSGPQVFEDVDDGEINRLTKQRIIFEGEVPYGALIGFQAIIMEEDVGYIGSGVDKGYTDFILGMADIADETLGVAAAAGTLATGSAASGAVAAGAVAGGGMVVGLIASGVALAYMAFSGGDDDMVGSGAAYATYQDLRGWELNGPKMFEMNIDGGDEGHYIIRWHIEFDKNASSMFDAPFNDWDEIHTGNFYGSTEHEILMVSDEMGPGDDGRFRVYEKSGKKHHLFYEHYTGWDHVATGDVDGNGYDDIVIATTGANALINICDANGQHMNAFFAPVTAYDGLAVADIDGDGKCEILLARDDDQTVYTYTSGGNPLGFMPIKNWVFDGVRYTSGDTRHDAFLVGDVMGDSKPEIVMLDLKNGPDSEIHIYAGNCVDGNELRPPIRFDFFGGTFTAFDAAVLADLNGDGKKELVVASDQGDGNFGCKMKVYDLMNNTMSSERYWPMYTGYDGFTAGDVLGIGKDQLVLAVDEDSKVYISM